MTREGLESLKQRLEIERPTVLDGNPYSAAGSYREPAELEIGARGTLPANMSGTTSTRHWGRAE